MRLAALQLIQVRPYQSDGITGRVQARGQRGLGGFDQTPFFSSNKRPVQLMKHASSKFTLRMSCIEGMAALEERLIGKTT